ncbi:tapasin-related protein [Solea solea]|uniref:tapasin-related protein n=1 Tax=Solea solea TaxID=90069 RepID=UPI00272BC19B|nr:tapasin-related protein [Solea solea]
MDLTLNTLICLYLCAGVLCAHQMPWLPCQFIDEVVNINNEGHVETQLLHREAMLQFGKKDDAPVNPHAITFLVTGSKLDLRRYAEGVEAEQLECEVRRYSTQGIHVRWPVKGAHEYSRWYSCTLKHGKGLFVITGFLRQSTDQTPSGEQDYRSWPAITDREVLATTVAMVIKTQTPSLKVGLRSQPKLHCQFAVDHKAPDITVEWHSRRRGERTTLFSYHSRSGQTKGSGVGVKNLADGDASYTPPFAKMSSEGTYICSVTVNPLFFHMDMSLNIEERPRVSINVGPVLLLQRGEEQKVICTAEGYYPLDVEIVWFEQDPDASRQRVGGPLPKALNNVLMSSHKHDLDMTYSLSAFFYLETSRRNPGRREFTCSVSHQSLRVPIKKSFILTVEEPSSWQFNLVLGTTMITLLGILCVMLLYLHSGRKKSAQKKPY